ncbi:hypothetical protein K438DRAFT_1992687 [Mycena galopus ATCC 62051]|nr:hypothetical protein K438DRAFT_1992687 [Mycena galopus ATCC 62051]
MLEGSDKVLWFKERFLEDEEIIEHLVHNETRRTHWTMHRPRNGWYIRIRSPAFQPGAFIPSSQTRSTCPARCCLSRTRMRLYHIRIHRYSRSSTSSSTHDADTSPQTAHTHRERTVPGRAPAHVCERPCAARACAGGATSDPKFE